MLDQEAVESIAATLVTLNSPLRFCEDLPNTL